ncbi:MULTISPECIES: hypothetical protein [unclassified Caballeronia]|uniref:hypothetical protein n=1 Tax=unclassified Caballeronia TaxID=2646786 RepID=UPI002027E05A|nr:MULTISPECIES: hypothetical protein [unclassified Caballeronia]MDR5768090.1 hypothetical protein [Caballeronia sp. LZ028]
MKNHEMPTQAFRVGSAPDAGVAALLEPQEMLSGQVAPILQQQEGSHDTHTSYDQMHTNLRDPTGALSLRGKMMRAFHHLFGRRKTSSPTAVTADATTARELGESLVAQLSLETPVWPHGPSKGLPIHEKALSQLRRVVREAESRDQDPVDALLDAGSNSEKQEAPESLINALCGTFEKTTAQAEEFELGAGGVVSTMADSGTTSATRAHAAKDALKKHQGSPSRATGHRLWVNPDWQYSPDIPPRMHWIENPAESVVIYVLHCHWFGANSRPAALVVIRSSQTAELRHCYFTNDYSKLTYTHARRRYLRDVGWEPDSYILDCEELPSTSDFDPWLPESTGKRVRNSNDEHLRAFIERHLSIARKRTVGQANAYLPTLIYLYNKVTNKGERPLHNERPLKGGDKSIGEQILDTESRQLTRKAQPDASKNVGLERIDEIQVWRPARPKRNEKSIQPSGWSTRTVRDGRTFVYNRVTYRIDAQKGEPPAVGQQILVWEDEGGSIGIGPQPDLTATRVGAVLPAKQSHLADRRAPDAGPYSHLN